MGYMACVTIRNRDLDIIAGDEKFGARVKAALRLADIVKYYSKDRSGEKQPVLSTQDLYAFEVERGRSDAELSPAEFFVSIPVHADVETLHIIHGGQQISPLPHQITRHEDAVVLATAMAAMGYRTKDVVTGEVRGKFSAEDRTLADYMHGWDMDELMNEGTTTLSVLIDGIEQVAEDATFGPRLAQAIRDYLLTMKEHSRAFDAKEIHGNVFSYDTISARGHCNPVQIACVTPPGETDVLILGQNWARELRPVPSLCQMTGDEKHLKRINELMEKSHRKMGDMMLKAGFQVRYPGKTRSESVPEWTKKEWPARPTAEPDAGIEP